MNDATRKFLEALGKRFLASGANEPKEWLFDLGLTTPLHRELSEGGLLEKVLGTTYGFGWRLTDTGVERVREITGLEKR